MIIRQLGRRPYGPTLEAMRAFTAARQPTTADELWLVEHEPVFTLGITGKREHLLRPSDIAVVQTDRGGQVTYHGPGQAVVYTLVDLRRDAIKVREFVTAIEAAVIDTLAAYNLHGMRRLGAPGIYLQPEAGDLSELEKIAALGLKIKNGCSYHGVSLNVNMDLTPFSWINPCGYPGLRTIDMANRGIDAQLDQVATTLAEALMRRIGAFSATKS